MTTSEENETPKPGVIMESYQVEWTIFDLFMSLNFFRLLTLSFEVVFQDCEL